MLDLRSEKLIAQFAEADVDLTRSPNSTVFGQPLVGDGKIGVRSMFTEAREIAEANRIKRQKEQEFYEDLETLWHFIVGVAKIAIISIPVWFMLA